MRQPRWLYHEPPCVVRWCGVYVFGAAAPLGEGDPLGLPLTPSAGWTLPEGAQVQCPRGVLAIRGKRHSKRGRLSPLGQKGFRGSKHATATATTRAALPPAPPAPHSGGPGERDPASAWWRSSLLATGHSRQPAMPGVGWWVCDVSQRLVSSDATRLEALPVSSSHF